MSTSLSNEYGAAKEKVTYSKTCVKRSLSKRPKISFQDKSSLKAGQTFIELPFVLQTLVLSIFKHGCFTQDLLYAQNTLSGPSNTYQFGESIPNFWLLDGNFYYIEILLEHSVIK